MSPPRRAQHFATGNKPSRISLTCHAYYRLPLQCTGTDCYNRVAGSGKVSGPGCRDCGAPTPHTRTRIVRFRDHTKVGVQALLDQYFDFFIAPDFFWCSRHWQLCWNWHQRHRGEVGSPQLLFFTNIIIPLTGGWVTSSSSYSFSSMDRIFFSSKIFPIWDEHSRTLV